MKKYIWLPVSQKVFAAVSIFGPASFQRIENVIQMNQSPGLSGNDKCMDTLSQNVRALLHLVE